jgi:hypothetical protein
MTVEELATYIASWTLRKGSQRQLNMIIDATGLRNREIDRAFQIASDRILAG